MDLEELKELQMQIIKKNKIGNYMGIILFTIIIILSIIILLLKDIPIYFILGVIFFEIVLGTIITILIKTIINGHDIQTFTLMFKYTFVLKALNNIFNEVEYYPDKGFTEDFAKTVGMLYTGDRFSANDYIIGKYKDIDFRHCDIQIEEKHEEKDKDGNKEEVWETIFKGRFMMFEFNKEFKADMQVVTRSFGVNILPRYKDFSIVKMEDMEFNNIFKVYAESEHEAFYILTPHFMERLKNIAKKLNCEIMFAFVNNNIEIALNNNQDSFEYNVFKPINEKEIEENIASDIKLITDFIEELRLENNLFKGD